MQDLLAHPAFQSAVAPLATSLLAASLLKRFGIQWQGIAVVAGLAMAVWLTVGFHFQPLTSTSKIILVSVFLPILALLIPRFSCESACQSGLLAVVTVAVALWVIWPVLGRQETLTALWMGGKVLIFSAVVTSSLVWLTRDDFARQGGAVLALGFGTGVATFIGSSALYGQLSFAVTAAVGGLVVIRLLAPVTNGERISMGSVALFAATIPLVLIDGAATIYAKLPSMALLFLAIVPLFAAIPVARKLKLESLWIRGVLAMVLGTLPAIPAIWLALNASEPLGY